MCKDIQLIFNLQIINKKKNTTAIQSLMVERHSSVLRNLVLD